MGIARVNRDDYCVNRSVFYSEVNRTMAKKMPQQPPKSVQPTPQPLGVPATPLPAKLPTGPVPQEILRKGFRPERGKPQLNK
ncbi:MAG: hypothetical protein M1318_07650 [Firmicutes bacterium]|jgi:hypothetical protein|nr:hypothetical protein [Bacillota bacterium]